MNKAKFAYELACMANRMKGNPWGKIMLPAVESSFPKHSWSWSNMPIVVADAIIASLTKNLGWTERDVALMKALVGYDDD